MTAEQASAAVERIYDRHLRVYDSRLDEMGSDPGDVLVYLRKHGHRMPEGVRCDDLHDAATLHLWLWWSAQERERWLFDTAVRLAVSRTEFAKVFGVTSRQGFRDRRDRLHALLDEGGPGRPDEQLVRADRRDAAGEVVGEEAWLVAARERVLQLSADLLEFEDRLDDDAVGHLRDVGRDIRGGECTVSTLMALGWALDAALDGTRDGDVWGRLRRLADRFGQLQLERKQAKKLAEGVAA